MSLDCLICSLTVLYVPRGVHNLTLIHNLRSVGCVQTLRLANNQLTNESAKCFAETLVRTPPAFLLLLYDSQA